MEIWLIILKYCGSVVGAFYGFYATITDFHELKDGKKVLTSKGKRGLIILGLSSLLALGTSGLSDYNEKKEKEISFQKEKNAKDSTIKEARARSGIESLKTKEDLKRVNEIIGKLNNQLEISGQAVEVSKTVSARTLKIAGNLSMTSNSIEHVLQETKEKMQFLEMRITFKVDLKYFLEDAYFKNLSPYPHSWQEKEIVDSLLSEHMDYFKWKVLKHWQFQLLLSKSKRFLKTDEKLKFIGSRDEGINLFRCVLDEYEGRDYKKGYIECRVDYKIPILPTSKITKLSDLSKLWALLEINFTKNIEFFVDKIYFYNTESSTYYDPLTQSTLGGYSLIGKAQFLKNGEIYNSTDSISYWSANYLIAFPSQLEADY